MDEHRQVPSGPVIPRHSPPSTGLGVTIKPEPLYELDLYQVAAIFNDNDLPRHRRSLMRYCEHDKLDCLKVEVAKGIDEWRVDEDSVYILIDQLKRLESQTRTGPGAPGHVGDGRSPVSGFVATPPDAGPAPTQPVMPGQVVVEPVVSPEGEMVAGGLTERETETPAVATEPVMSGPDAPNKNADSEGDSAPLIEQYEKRLADKDKQIEFYEAELTDRRAQIRDMKNLIDGQNQLLEAINHTQQPIFQALANSIKQLGRSALPISTVPPQTFDTEDDDDELETDFGR